MLVRLAWMLRSGVVALSLTFAILLAGTATALASYPPNMWVPSVVAVVWPQNESGGGTSVASSRAVNVSVWPVNQTYCDTSRIAFRYDATLYVAKNNDPGDFVPIGPQFIQRVVNGVRFVSAEFNGVPADLANGPAARFTFVAGPSFESNVWAHALDPRTHYPHPVVPTGFVTDLRKVRTGGNIDLRIQIVWPHDAAGRYAPPDRATFVNVAADIFQHGTLLSVPPDFVSRAYLSQPYLEVAEDNQPIHDPVATAGRLGLSSDTADVPLLRPQEVSYVANGQMFPRWVFNNIPVQPGHQYHFLVRINGTGDGLLPPVEHPNIWTYAASARTSPSSPPIPPPCIP